MAELARIRDVRERNGKQLFIVEFDEYIPDYRLKKISSDIEVLLHDGRGKSPAQNKIIHALIGEITREYMGSVTSLQKKIDAEDTKIAMKSMFCDLVGRAEFSVADATMSDATEFIEFLINFCIENGVKLKNKELYKDFNIQHWVFCCLIHNKCAIDGTSKNVEKHHAANLVGMGRNRKKIDHLDSCFISLSAEYHQEVHNIGWERFKAKHHVDFVKLNAYWIKELKIK